MIQNYFKIAWRNLMHQWQYSLVNITGLAVGMACSILIFLFVHDEQSYDRYHSDADRIYRVTMDLVNNDGQQEPLARTPRAMAFTLRNDLPEIEASATLFQCRQMVMKYKDRLFFEDRVYKTDSNLFKVFSFPFIRGSAAKALNTPHTILLTELSARKYFGSEDPVGKMIQSENTHYFVSGVLKDVPANSHFRFDMLIPLRNIGSGSNTIWGYPNNYTYVKLKASTDVKDLETKLPAHAAKYKPNSYSRYHLQPLTSIHLNSQLKGELETNGDKSTVRVLMMIAFFIIFIASINYINLATARSTRRAKEVGIRKASGALRPALIGQFLAESVMVTMLAFLFSIIIMGALVNPFNDLTGRQYHLFQWDLWQMWLYLAGIALGIGIVAGLYPAIYLSSFNPVKVLKGGTLIVTGSGTWLRKTLVGLQFTISICLIIGTIVVIDQMNYIGSKDAGFDRENVIIVPNASRLGNRSTLENRIKQLSGVSHVGASTSVIGAANWAANIRPVASETDRMINFCQINYDYIDALGIELLDGRPFSPDFPADTIDTIILNETAVKELNLVNPVGQKLIWDAEDLDSTIYGSVVGVVKDFHFESFHEPIKPFAFLIRNHFFVQNDFTSRLFIKTTNPAAIVPQLEALWKEYVPHRPFSYMNEDFRRLHAEEERFKTLFTWLTSLAIFIVCLGLFALVAFVVEQRTKEIGIRKVLGASGTSIVIMINKDFMKLIMVSLTIASPVTMYFMNRWLEGFAYHINLKWWIFVLAGIAALVISFIATGYQSIKASLINPASSLKAFLTLWSFCTIW